MTQQQAPTPVLTLELLEDVDTSMCWRVTLGPLHACGPTPEDAIATLGRARMAS